MSSEWMPPTNEELAAYILPWAKVAAPEAYAKTLLVANRPETFRAYMARLIELLWERSSADERRNIPLRLLEVTGLTVRMRHPATGLEIEVKGVRAQPREWGFCEIASAMTIGLDFGTLARMKAEWGLEIDDGQFQEQARAVTAKVQAELDAYDEQQRRDEIARREAHHAEREKRIEAQQHHQGTLL